MVPSVCRAAQCFTFGFCWANRPAADPDGRRGCERRAADTSTVERAAPPRHGIIEGFLSPDTRAPGRCGHDGRRARGRGGAPRHLDPVVPGKKIQGQASV
eukprot:4308682-Prymnesium_polylepis.1